jgi:enoyl-CoA hydratase/carnithine racemase
MGGTMFCMHPEHVEALQHQLQQWAQPGSGVRAVLLDSSTPKAFCSGEDTEQ